MPFAVPVCAQRYAQRRFGWSARQQALFGAEVGLLAMLSLTVLARANPLGDAPTLRIALVANGVAIAAVGLCERFGEFLEAPQPTPFWQN